MKCQVQSMKKEPYKGPPWGNCRKPGMTTESVNVTVHIQKKKNEDYNQRNTGN